MAAINNILLIGNCQVKYTTECLNVMADVKVEYIMLNNLINSNGWLKGIKTKIENAEKIYLTTQFKDHLSPLFGEFGNKIELMPFIKSTAFHPDIIPCKTKDNRPVFTLMHNNNSALILYGFLNGLSVEKTMQLFCKEVFEHLGYFNGWNESLLWAKSEEELTGWPVLEWYHKWKNGGSFVYTTNHPKLNVYAELSKYLLEKHTISPKMSEPEKVIVDRGFQYSVWPIYPEIAERLGFRGSYEFKMAAAIQKKNNYDRSSISLQEFIVDCFDKYSTIGIDNIRGSRFNKGPFASLMGSQAFNKAVNNRENKSPNPYRNLPDYKFWRRSVTKLNMAEIDPVIRAKFPIFKTDKVATAGSCFAQHLARTLKQHDFNYFVTEKPSEALSKEQVKMRNYDIYSARFGNIYTTRHLVQMMERIENKFIPVDNAWLREDGKFVDPFRPVIEPNGFDTIKELEESRREHFDSVIEMFENLDVFIFTLGLTEAWRSKIDGAVFPLAPGVSGGVMDNEKYEFVNFTVKMVIEDLRKFVDHLLRINQNAKVILTVSPVPMIATYEDSHVITSTTYSKSVLRVAAEEISRGVSNIAYFPSYEIITSNFSRGKYYSEDLRSVTEEGIEHVMRLLIQHYMCEVEQISKISMDDIICEEELLDSI